MRQIGRSIIQEEQTPRIIKLSLLYRMIRKYYSFRISFIDRRKKKYASYAAGYRVELFNSCVYMKQSYLYKVEALYSKQELRDFERRRKKYDRNN